MNRDFSIWLGVFLRGLAMGAADVVPGVSGGTIAYITGIYERLIGAITRVDMAFIRLLLARQWQSAWQYIDATFLLVLAAGIATSIFSLAHIISYLLEVYPLFIWSFFVGLVLASAIILFIDLKRLCPITVLALILGCAAALLVNQLRPTQLEPSLIYIFFCGMIAICAMLLPGISGSFLLLVLGVYPVVLGAIKSLDLQVMVVFMAGAGIGILGFAKLLNWAMAHARAVVFATLTGFLLGSVAMIWPWKVATEQMLGDAPLLVNVWPATFSQATGQSSQLTACLLLMIFGSAIVLMMARWNRE